MVDLEAMPDRITPTADEASGLSRPAALVIVAAVMGASAMLGIRNAPDPLHPDIRRWYKRLRKPAYTPPDPVFGAVWPVLETAFAVGDYRLLRKPAGMSRNVAVGLWTLETGMIGGWAELFFRRRKLGPSAIASAAMLAVGAGYVATAVKADRAAAAAAVPLVAWLGFATLLTERIWVKNRSSHRDQGVSQTA